MALFNKAQPRGNGDNGKPPERKSTFQLMFEELNAAEQHLQNFQHLVSVLAFDFQKPLDYIAMRRDSLVKAFEEAGGDEQQTNIEQEIAAYIPKSYQPPIDDKSS